MPNLSSSHSDASRERNSGSPTAQTAQSSLPLATSRNTLFVVLFVLSVAIFWGPLRTLLDYSFRRTHEYDQYTFTLLIPLIAAGLVFLERRRTFQVSRNAWLAGTPLIAAAIVLRWVSYRRPGYLGPDESLSVAILGLVLFWIGDFVLCYGTQAFVRGMFPLLFLVLTVPLPSALLNIPVSIVRSGSAEIAYAVFKLAGVPVLRDGFLFMLPGLNIEVAKECSGIHSTLALFIVSLLAGHLARLRAWQQALLAVLVFPIVCLTNGIRITSLSLLSIYVDPRFMYSDLHRDGGIPFFAVALVLLMFVLQGLRKVRFQPPARERMGQ